MKPQPMITVRFVKRILFVFIGGIVLLCLIPGFSSVLKYLFLPVIILTMIVLQFGFPKTQITVDDETICFKRTFPNWYPLKKYYLHELTIPHSNWDNWIKVFLSDRKNNHQNYYLFFKNEHLCFAVETHQNSDLEYWIQKKFPERSLQTKNSFRKYRDRYNTLKEKNRMRVF